MHLCLGDRRHAHALPAVRLTIAAAARRLGVTPPRAIRGRIRRGTIEWKPVGNTGRLVRVPSGDAPPDDPGDGPEDELDRMREEVADAMAAGERWREKAEQARVDLARAEERVAAKDQALAAAERERDREIARGDRLATELADARRPWLERVIAVIRR